VDTNPELIVLDVLAEGLRVQSMDINVRTATGKQIEVPIYIHIFGMYTIYPHSNVTSLDVVPSSDGVRISGNIK